jgi:hypothetical protein
VSRFFVTAEQILFTGNKVTDNSIKIAYNLGKPKRKTKKIKIINTILALEKYCNTGPVR